MTNMLQFFPQGSVAPRKNL